MRSVVLVMLLCSCHGDDDELPPPRKPPPAAPADARTGPDPVAIEIARQGVERAETAQADTARQIKAAEDLVIHARTAEARNAALAELDRLHKADIEGTRALAAARAKLEVARRVK
jgi:hypothetical protein